MKTQCKPCAKARSFMPKRLREPLERLEQRMSAKRIVVRRRSEVPAIPKDDTQ